MKKILCLTLLLTISWLPSSFARINSELDFNDSVVFSSWQKNREFSRVTYYSLVKYIDNKENATLWIRSDSSTAWGHLEFADLNIDGKLYKIRQIENESKYDRNAYPEPNLWKSWNSSFYALTADDVAAIEKGNNVELTCYLKNGKTISYKLSPEHLVEWKQVLSLTKADFAKTKND